MADQHQFYTILHSTYASYAHNGGVGQSTVTTKLRSENTNINNVNGVHSNKAAVGSD